MKKFYSLAIFTIIVNLLITNTAFSQAVNDYRTAASGNWNSGSTWQRWNGSTWVTNPAEGTPNSTDGVITIQNSHTVTVTAAVTVDQVTVDAGGQVTVNSGQTWTIADPTGTDLTINGTLNIAGTLGQSGGPQYVVNGTVINSGAVTTGYSSFTFNSGSLYQHSQSGGTLPTATWNPNSVIELGRGASTSMATATQTIGQLKVINNTPATVTGGTLTVSNGTGNDLVIESGSSLTIGTNGNITLANSAGLTADISGTLTINAGRTFNHGTSTSVTTVTGSIVNAGTISNATAARLNFSSGGVYVHNQSAGTIPTAGWNASSLCQLNLWESSTDDPAGLSQNFGNFKLAISSTGSNTGQIGTMSIQGDFIVANTGTRPIAVSTANTDQSLTIGGDLLIQNGTFIIEDGGNGGSQITVTGKFDQSGGTFDMNQNTSASVATLNVAGDFSITNGTLTETGSGSGSINFTGVTNYTSSGTRFANTINFTVNSGKTLMLGNNDFGSGSGGTFTLSSGGSVLGIGHASGITTTGTASNVRVTGTRTYDASATYVYNGGAAQITGTGLPATVSGLTINNSTGVSLSQATAVSGVLTLTNGILTTTSNLLTINAGGSSTGASDASFVNGPLKKSGNTDFSFPVGKTGVGYMKIDIASIANGTNDANTSFTAQYFRASAGTTFGTTGLSGLGLQGVSNCEYWTIDRIDAGNNATANITMYWNAHSPCGSASYLVDPILGLKIAHFNTGTNQWDAIGGGAPSGNASAGSLTWSGASDFSPFALAALVGSNSPLPVMFADVKAYAKNNGVQIDWSNLTERDLTGYAVERSVDGKNFSDIAQYQPKSNMNDKAVYTSFDANPVAGANFYRIRATEIGGKLIYSKILRVEMSGKQGFTMYPNPVIGKQLTINLTGVAQGSYNVRIINANGQDVYRKMLINSSSSTSEMIELPAAVKPGVYTMLISGDNFNATKMFVVQ